MCSLITTDDPSSSGDASTEGPPPRATGAMDWSQLELRRQAVCAAEAEEMTQQASQKNPEDSEHTSDIGHCVYTIGMQFCFGLLKTTLEGGKYLI